LTKIYQSIQVQLYIVWRTQGQWYTIYRHKKF